MAYVYRRLTFVIITYFLLRIYGTSRVRGSPAVPRRLDRIILAKSKSVCISIDSGLHPFLSSGLFLRKHSKTIFDTEMFGIVDQIANYLCIKKFIIRK